LFHHCLDKFRRAGAFAAAYKLSKWLSSSIIKPLKDAEIDTLRRLLP
jgi:hypothetical protein